MTLTFHTPLHLSFFRVRPIEMMLALLYNTSDSGKILLALPQGITKEFMLTTTKQGMLNHISNMKRHGDFSLSQIERQIRRNLFNFDDGIWSIEEDQTNWSYEESFVHSLAGRTYNIDPRGWFRH